MKLRNTFLLAALIISFNVNAENNTKSETKPVINNLQEGSVYKTKQNEYELISKENKTISTFKLTDKKDCNTIFEQINSNPIFVDTKKIKDNQVSAQEKDSKIKHLFYCSEGVLVDIQIP